MEGHLGTLEQRPLVLEYYAPFWRTYARQPLDEKLDGDLGGARWGLLFDLARWSKPFLVAGSILLIFFSLANSTALAQESFSSTAYDVALPETPPTVTDYNSVWSKWLTADRHRQSIWDGARHESKRAAGCARDTGQPIGFRHTYPGVWQQRAVRLHRFTAGYLQAHNDGDWE